MPDTVPGPVPPGPDLPTPPSAGHQPPPLPRYPVPPHLEHATQRPDPRYLPRPSKTMAGWALALAIVPCFGVTPFVAIGLAITVLVRSRDGRDHGKGLAIAALVIAPLWIVGIVASAVLGVFQGLTADAERDASGRVIAQDDVSVVKLRVGDCFDHPALFDGGGDQEVESSVVEAMPCAKPHQFEVYKTFDIPGDEFPGDRQVSEAAARGCLPAFRSFVGVAYGKSRLEPYLLYPRAGSWRLLDDHGVTCMIGEPGELTTGSLEGSRR